MKYTIILSMITLVTFCTMLSCSGKGDAPPLPAADATPADSAATIPLPPPPSTIPYEGKVISTRTEGAYRFDTVASKFSCKTAEDCTQTQFSNAPKNKLECTCKAPCTPYIVNREEFNRREVANRELCKPTDWFGPNCPAPACTFDEFDDFKCIEGRCLGIAMGQN